MQIIHDIFEIPVDVWNEGKHFQLPNASKSQSVLNRDTTFKKELEKEIMSIKSPHIFIEDELVYYGVFYGDGFYYSLGPVSRKTMKKQELTEYKRKHELDADFTIHQFGLNLMSKLLSLLYLEISGVMVPYSDISLKSKNVSADNWEIEGNYETYQLFQSESGRQHGQGITFENQFVQFVKNGDVEAMKEAMGGDVPDISDIGEIASTSAKQMEYLLVTVLTLITRAAVEGGMNPEEAYALGDVYLREIERCSNDVNALTLLGIKAQIEFTEKVRNAKKRRNDNIYIKKCKDFIVKNLRKDIHVGDIAPELGVSRAYLSHKFTEVEGITIQQYILKERCEHAANLLKYSDYPISVIAEYMRFSSQSHFGSNFKKIYGMTPKEYRIMFSR